MVKPDKNSIPKKIKYKGNPVQAVRWTDSLGDVSPVPMKILMYQDNKKFSVRGTTRVGHQMGGEFVFDNAFKNAPAAFRKYADNLWKQHKKETWDQ